MRPKKNLIGLKFNRLTVIEEISKQLKSHNRIKWLCKCDCGNEVIVSANKLANGHTKSCGCIRKEVDYGKGRRKEFGESAKNMLIWTYKYNAKRKNLEFLLTDDELTKLFEGNCHYCGCEPKNLYTKPNTYGWYKHNGIDRKNNKIGYITSNVVSCCSICNYTKHKFNYEDFLLWIKKSYEYLKNNGNIC